MDENCIMCTRMRNRSQTIHHPESGHGRVSGLKILLLVSQLKSLGNKGCIQNLGKK